MGVGEESAGPETETRIPSGLLDDFGHGNAAVFLGAGASVASGLPTWSQLVDDVAGELLIDEDDQKKKIRRGQLAAIPQYYENLFGRRRLNRKIAANVSSEGRRPSNVHALIAKLPCSLYYTTNFDVLLEDALREQNRTYATIASEEDARYYTDEGLCQVRKIHGCVTQPRSFVVTRTDFAQFQEMHPMVTRQLAMDLTSKSFLFVGYSLGDPDFNSVYDEVFFRMAPVNRHHYITVLGADRHEIRDLELRGLEPILLDSWPGETPDEKLVSFLTELCEATSEALHVERFFRGLKRGQNVPVILPARLNKLGETYVYWTDMDLHAFHAVKESLSLLGVSSERLADTKVLPNAEQILAQDVVLIGSPHGNLMTKFVLDEVAAGKASSIHERFEDLGAIRALQSEEIRLEAPDPARTDSGGEFREYAIIARYSNPWAPGRHLYIMCGLWAMGTHAIGDFLMNQRVRELPWQEDRSAWILEVRYTVHDPFEYQYESYVFAGEDSRE